LFYLFIYFKKNTLDFPSSPSTKQALILVLDVQTHCNYSKRKKGGKKKGAIAILHVTQQGKSVKSRSLACNYSRMQNA